MILLLCVCFILVLVSSGVPPWPPLKPKVDDNLLQWSPADEDGNTTYSVQYRRYGENEWKNVSSCIQTSGKSCNVMMTTHEAEHGCVKLKVQAVRNGHRSEAVEACSTRGVRCSPQVRLSSRPGSLTVHLSRDHELGHNYADHAQYQLYYRKQGHSELSCRKSLSSVVLTDLDEGQTYCVQVQYILYSKPEGLPSCFQCQDIPLSSAGSKHSWIIVVVVLTLVAVTVGSIMAYLMIFHRKKVKGWLRPEPTPEFLTLSLHETPVSSPVEESCSTITAFILSEDTLAHNTV